MHKLQKTKKRSQLKEQRHNFTFNFVGNINNAASRSDKSSYSEQNNKLTWQSDKNSSRNPIFLSCTSSVFSRRSQRVSADLRSQWLTKKCHVWKLLFVSGFFLPGVRNFRHFYIRKLARRANIQSVPDLIL